MENIITEKVAIITITEHGYYKGISSSDKTSVSMDILDEYIQELVEEKYLAYYYDQSLPHDYGKIIDNITDEIRKYNYYKGKINSSLGDLEIDVDTNICHITKINKQ